MAHVSKAIGQMYISSANCTFPSPDVHSSSFLVQLHMSLDRYISQACWCTFLLPHVYILRQIYISLTRCRFPWPDVHYHQMYIFITRCTLLWPDLFLTGHLHFQWRFMFNHKILIKMAVPVISKRGSSTVSSECLQIRK